MKTPHGLVLTTETAPDILRGPAAADLGAVMKTVDTVRLPQAGLGTKIENMATVVQEIEAHLQGKALQNMRGRPSTEMNTVDRVKASIGERMLRF